MTLHVTNAAKEPARARPAWAILFGSLCAASAAQAESLNVSQVATGTQQAIDFATAATYPQLPCGACSFSASSTAFVNPDSAPALMPHAWPAASQSTLPLPPSVARDLPTPQGQVDAYGVTNYYDSNSYRAANVSFGATKQVTSSTFGSGTAASLLAYHVKVANDAGKARDYFVELTVPQSDRGVSVAYSLTGMGDSNGGTYAYFRQNSAFSRSIVEVLVDGLPVWSQTYSYNFPADFDGNAWDKIVLNWGNAQTGSVLLYLGKLAPNASLTVDYTIRTEVRADAPDCGSTYYSGWGDPELDHHCFELRETRKLPATAAGTLDIKVYAKEIP